MKKMLILLAVWVAIWCAGCAVAEYLLPAKLARCWIMLWGAWVYCLQACIDCVLDPK